MEKGSSRSLIMTIVGLVVIVAIVVVIALVVHNNNNNNQAALTSDKQQVEKNWKTFFAASTPMSQREGLLQNGKSFSTEMDTEFAAIGSQEPSATVNSVTLTNGNTGANVNYSVDLGGHPVLVGQNGTAVEVGGQWKVSDATICGLLKMDGQSPSACKNL